MAEFFVHVTVLRASVKLTLGNNDEQASDQLTLQCRLEKNEQQAFENAHPELARPEPLRAIETFVLNIYSSESMMHQVHTNLRTVITETTATVNLLDKPDDIALASRYFSDVGRSDRFNAEIHFRAEGLDYVPIAVDLTMSRGLLA